MNYELTDYEWNFSSFVSFLTLLIASSDNKVSKEEINTIKYEFTKHEVLNNAKALSRLDDMSNFLDSDGTNFDKAYDKFKTSLSEDDLKDGINIGARVAFADGKLTSGEKFQLYKISSNCGFDKAFVDEILRQAEFVEIEEKNYSRAKISQIYQSSVKDSQLEPREYSQDFKFCIDDLIKHKDYGLGQIHSVTADGHIVVVFEDELVVLAHKG